VGKKATEFVSFSVQRVFKLLLCFIKQSLPFFFIFLENGCEIGDPPRTNIIIYLFSYIFVNSSVFSPDVSFWCRVNAELTAAVLKHVRVFKMMTPAPKESQLPRDALTAGK
jgi:hypothetical protein